MKQTDLEAIRHLKTKAAEELADLDRQRLAIEQWLSELSVTERTVAKLLSIDLPEPSAKASEPLARSVRAGGKPRGSPSIYIMATTLLRESADGWIESRDIVKAIKERWWPTAETKDISPTLWRLSKTGKLRKEGTRYGLSISEAVENGTAPVSELMAKISERLNAPGPIRFRISREMAEEVKGTEALPNDAGRASKKSG